MPSTYDKARKQIAKKRNGKIEVLHEYSRDSKRLKKASIRDDRLDKLAASRSKREQPLMERVAACRDKMNAERAKSFTQEEVTKFVNELALKHDEELNTMKKARRPGRPPTAKEDLLKRRHEALQAEHETGFLIPDLTSEANVAHLELWEGSWAYLSTLSWIKVSKSGQVRPTVFQPGNR